MKTKVFNLFVLLALGLSAITSCTSDFESEVEFYLNPENIELESQRGSMATFTISTDGEWTVTNVPSFVKVSSTKGKGTTIITVQTVAENNTSRDYEDIIVVSVDGAKETKSITIKANIEFNGTVSGKYLSDITASQTVTLETIPRSSGLSIPTSVNTGSSLTSTITPSSSTDTQKALTTTF